MSNSLLDGESPGTVPGVELIFRFIFSLGDMHKAVSPGVECSDDLSRAFTGVERPEEGPVNVEAGAATGVNDRVVNTGGGVLIPDNRVPVADAGRANKACSPEANFTACKVSIGLIA